jgi:hypothetical protein
LLTRFRAIKDKDFDHISYRTNVPSVAPMAYLNVIFQPPPRELLSQRVAQLTIPSTLASFYAEYNGAALFSGAINIFGLLPDKYLLDRRNWFEKRLPLNIVDVQAEHAHRLDELNMLCFADYGYDRSLVCIERNSQRVYCFVGEAFDAVRATWLNLDEWLETEIERIAMLFDESGILRVSDEKECLPRECRPS